MLGSFGCPTIKINIKRLHLEELRVTPIQAIPISANTGARGLESGV